MIRVAHQKNNMDAYTAQSNLHDLGVPLHADALTILVIIAVVFFMGVALARE